MLNVAQFVSDGASICLGTAPEALIPFAAGHEIIRPRKRDLVLIGPIADILFDQLIGAGCVRKVIGAWVGNVTLGSRTTTGGPLSRVSPAPWGSRTTPNFTVSLALLAGSLGAPYIPTRHHHAPGAPPL